MRPVAGWLVVILAAGLLASWWWLRPALPPAERGRRLAERQGCFGCHGPEGTRGTANPGRTEGEVPTWVGDVMMYAERPEQVREWIEQGMTRVRASRRSYREERERGLLKMPAFEHRLSRRQIDDLVAFVLASAGEPTPDGEMARYGYRRAEELGCFGCHGGGGRLARPNPGSFRGYVPSWNSRDFADLVRNEDEFREWVEEGRCRRLARNPLARFFLERAPLHMPAYRDHLGPGDEEALWAYVGWLRTR